MVAKCKVNHGIFLAQSNPIVILTIGIRPWWYIYIYNYIYLKNHRWVVVKTIPKWYVCGIEFTTLIYIYICCFIYSNLKKKQKNNNKLWIFNGETEDKPSIYFQTYPYTYTYFILIVCFGVYAHLWYIHVYLTLFISCSFWKDIVCQTTG
jgi:hypothetical protein